MIICSTLELVALAVWIGGLVVIIAAVIPTVFNSFGMEPGGRFLTRVFDGYNRLTAAAIVMLVSTSAWRVRASRGAASIGGESGMAVRRPEAVLLTVMVIMAALIGLVLGPASVALQEQAFAAEGEVAKKAAYDAFFRTHTVVRGLYVVNLGLGIALLAVKVRGWMGHGKAAA
ncbi:MAG: DUF4149 domain-containing protein [Nitrospirae bacterium]|nr:DUF4149 domain-containing protein [Nitrospirota bacterium]